MKTILCCFLLTLFISQIGVAQTDANSENENNTSEEQELEIPEVFRPIHEVKIYQPGEIIQIKKPHYQDPEFSSYTAKLGQTKLIKISKLGHDEIFAGIDINLNPGEYLISLETEKKQIESLPFIVTMNNPVQFLSPTEQLAAQQTLLPKDKIIPNLLWSNLFPNYPFVYPMKSEWSSTFGFYFEPKPNEIKSKKNTISSREQELQRIDYISVDIQHPTTIVSPSDAVCFSIRYDENFGYTILLDHGMGLFSEISGLNNLTVSEQDRIKKNAVIANFTTEDFYNIETQNSNVKHSVRWRVFLNKATINPHHLIKLQ